MLLSKLIHLLTSLPIPNSFVMDINKIFFQFLWNMKPDKIKRNSICMNYLDGGLKMVNTYDFVKSLKLAWVKRIVFESESQWCKLLRTTYIQFLNMNNFLMMGGDWYNTVLNKIKNKFWLETFENWKLFYRNLNASCNYDITQSCLWYNSHISKEILYFPKWFKKGIYLVGDLIDSNGRVISLENLNEIYRFNPNILEYYRIKALVKTFVETYKIGQFFPYSRPPLPFHMQFLLKANKGCRNFYKTLGMNCNKLPKCTLKWSEILGIHIEDAKVFWAKVFKACFKLVVDNQIVWFQYKIIHDILDTKHYLDKVKLITDNMCSFCNMHPETTLHLLSECSYVVDLWTNIENWIRRKLNIDLKLDITMKIIGYYNFDEYYWPLNFILLFSKYYIYQSSKRGKSLNIFSLQNIIKDRFHEQKYISGINSILKVFEKRWQFWQHLLTDL